MPTSSPNYYRKCNKNNNKNNQTKVVVVDEKSPYVPTCPNSPTATTTTKMSSSNDNNNNTSTKDNNDDERNSFLITPSVEDYTEVGNPAILQSPHVSEGPGRIAKAPIPSIYVDDRGDIHRLRVGGNRINILYSKQSVMRSGYFHPHVSNHFILSGQIEVWTLSTTGTDKTIYNQQEYFYIPPYIPHILYFLQDTVLIEWYEKNVEFQCYYYHPYRKIVDIQNSILSTSSNTTKGSSISRHQRLVPQDDNPSDYGSNITTDLNKASSGGSSYFWTTTLLVMTISTVSFISGIVVATYVNHHPSSNHHYHSHRSNGAGMSQRN